MIKKIIKPLIIALTIQLASCAVLIKDSELNDYASTARAAKDTIYSAKYSQSKINNVAIFGFSSNLFTGSRQGNSNIGMIATISEAASQRGCIALDKTYEVAVKSLKSNRFNVITPQKLASNKTFMKTGALDFPGMCTSGKTRINILPPTKEMNKLFDELKVDSLLTFNVNAENDMSSSAVMQLWAKGDKEAKLVWSGNLSRAIKVESDTQGMFSDLQDLSRSDEQKIALTSKVFTTAFKLLYAKMIQEIQ